MSIENSKVDCKVLEEKRKEEMEGHKRPEGFKEEG